MRRDMGVSEMDTAPDDQGWIIETDYRRWMNGAGGRAALAGREVGVQGAGGRDMGLSARKPVASCPR